MTTTTTDLVGRFLDCVLAGDGVPQDLFTPDALLDATTPGWRFTQHGPVHVAGQLSAWFADPGELHDVVRTPLPNGGELVRFLLTWVEDGEPMAAHQAHVMDLVDGRISRLELYCGGRWNAHRQAEIAEACA